MNRAKSASLARDRPPSRHRPPPEALHLEGEDLFPGAPSITGTSTAFNNFVNSHARNAPSASPVSPTHSTHSTAPFSGSNSAFQRPAFSVFAANALPKPTMSAALSTSGAAAGSHSAAGTPRSSRRKLANATHATSTTDPHH